jgi:nucleoid-associated protein YgaU
MKRLLVLTALIVMVLAGCNKPPQSPSAPLALEMRGDELMPGAGPVPSGSEMDEGTGPKLPGDGVDVAMPPPPPPPPPPAPVVTHVVQPKDTLWSIATKYYGDGKQWKRIAEANGIADATKLRVGAALTIPQ